MTSASENKVGLPAGSVVDGRYRVVRVLDLGGTGVVHQVEHVGTGRKLALKTLLDPTNEGRLEQEARAASHLRNSHAVKIVDMGRSAEVGAYIVMELLEGTSLRALIDEVGQLPLDLVANVALQVCECLDEAHAAGIVHRDLKPGNIHLAPTFGTHHHVTVLDFGAVKLQGPEIRSQISPQEDLTRVGSTVGTPFYMSLEQLRGNASVDAVSDVYSLCVVLHEMLTGTRPFQADSLGDLVYALVQTKPPRVGSIRPDVPPDLAEIIERGLSSVRETRPRSAREVAQVLAPLGDPAYALWLRVPAARASGPGASGAPMPPAASLKPPAAPVPVPPAPRAPSPPLPPPAPSAPRLAPPPPPSSPGARAPAAPLAPPPRPGLRPPSVGTSVQAGPPRPRPPDPRREPEDASALTAMPSAAMARVTMGEQPTAALPSVADVLPDLLQDPTTSDQAGRREPPVPAPRGRQDTPTEMFVQDVHGAGPAAAPAAAPAPAASAAPDDDDDDDGGRTRVAQDVAGSPAAISPAHGAPPPRASKPDLGSLSSRDDDNPTSVIDLDALNEAARRKAAAPSTTPPPAPGSPAIGLPDLAIAGSHHAIGGSAALGSPVLGGGAMGGLAGLPVGATDTMRLDVESLSGPLSHARIAADAEKAGETFDPSRISLHDAPRPVPGPLEARPIDPVDTAIHPRPPASAGLPSFGGPAGGPIKPAWQVQVDQGIAAVTASSREATARFLAWYRVLRPNEQMAFVAGTVLGFAIVVMLFILWLR